VTPQLVQLVFRGLHGFSLTAHFLQASTYSREVVGSARSGHVSSHQLGRVFGGALWPAGWRETVRKVVNFPRQVSASPGAISHSSGRSDADETLAGGTGSGAAAGSPQGGDTSETGGDGDTALGYGVGEPYTLCRRSAPPTVSRIGYRTLAEGKKLWSLGWAGRRVRRPTGRWGHGGFGVCAARKTPPLFSNRI
jgi:hypothetical protein